MSLSKKSFFVPVVALLLLVFFALIIIIRMITNIRIENQHPSLVMSVSSYPKLILLLFKASDEKSLLFLNKKYTFTLTDKPQAQSQMSWQDDNNGNHAFLGTSIGYINDGNHENFIIHVADYPRIVNDELLSDQIFSNQLLVDLCFAQVSKGLLSSRFNCYNDYENEINFDVGEIRRLFNIKNKSNQ